MRLKAREKAAGLDYDEILDYIGQFGPFQRRIFLWLSLVTTAAGIAVVVFAFTGFEPKYRCRVAECEDPASKYFATDQEGNLNLPSFYTNESIELKDRCKIPRRRFSICIVRERSILILSRNEGDDCEDSSFFIESSSEFIRYKLRLLSCDLR